MNLFMKLKNLKNKYNILSKEYSPFHIKFENETTMEITQRDLRKANIIDNIRDYVLKNVLKEIRAKGKFDKNEFIKFCKNSKNR